MNKFFFIIIAFVFFLNSCASKKNVILLQDIEDYQSNNDSTSGVVKIKKNDLLSIVVSSVDRKSAAPFNLPTFSTINSDVTSANSLQRLQTYLVDSNGEIKFPVLGSINLLGKTTIEATNYIKKQLLKYIKNPIVNLRITNFKVSIMGEVRSPGVYTITDERITVLEALSRAGDMTIFGKRTNVLVVREENGVKKYNKLDFTNKSILSSPYYYLQQNDVVIVSPNGAQVQSSASNRNGGLYVSVAGVIITIISILTR